MDCSLPGSSVHGILQARILERVAVPFSRGSSWPRDQPGFPALQVDSLPSGLPWWFRQWFILLQETWEETGVRSLGWEDLLEKRKATDSSILAWRIPWTVHGVVKSQTWLSNFYKNVTNNKKSEMKVSVNLLCKVYCLTLLSMFNRTLIVYYNA